jgi:hypothetical protein
LSGTVSTALLWTGEFGFNWGPGFVFAILVLLPWCCATRVHAGLTVLALILAPIGYHAAVLTLLAGPYGMFTSGAVGSAIMLLPILLGGSTEARRAAGLAIVVG